MKTEEIQITNDLGQILKGRLYSPEGPPLGRAVFCHGLFSSKDAYKINMIAADIAAAGFGLLTFDFSFVAGMPESFRNFSIMQEVRDLQSAVEFLHKRGKLPLHLIGSSMGGVVALLYASSRPEMLSSLILIATPVDLSTLAGTLSGKANLDNLPEEQATIIDGFPIGNKFFREALSIDMDAAVRSVSVPTLVIHGGRDMVVDVQNAQILEERLATANKIVVIPDGDHNLSRDEDLKLLKSEVPAWLAAHGNDRILKPQTEQG